MRRREFEVLSRDGKGSALDAEFSASTGAAYKVRVAQITYPGLVVEVTLTGPEKVFPKLEAAWTHLLGSLRRTAKAG